MNVNIRFAVGLVVYDAQRDRFLILRRNPERYKGWGLIKGGIEQGEFAVQACVREAHEEIGVLFDESGLKEIGHVSAYYDNTHQRVVHVQWFMVQVAPGLELRLQAAEWVEYRWATFEEALYALSWQAQQRVIRIVQSILVSR